MNLRNNIIIVAFFISFGLVNFTLLADEGSSKKYRESLLPEIKLSLTLDEIQFDSNTDKLKLRVLLKSTSKLREVSIFNPFNRAWLPKPVRVFLVDDKGKEIGNWNSEHDRYSGSRTDIQKSDWYSLERGMTIGFDLEKFISNENITVTLDELPKNLFVKVNYVKASFIEEPREISCKDFEIFFGFWAAFNDVSPLVESKPVRLDDSVLDKIKKNLIQKGSNARVPSTSTIP